MSGLQRSTIRCAVKSWAVQQAVRSSIARGRIMKKQQSTREISGFRSFEVNSWEDLRRKVSEASHLLRLKPDEELWYRGGARREFRLIPSLLRVFSGKRASRKEVRELETDLFFEFLAKARTDKAQLDQWDVLFLMQHYRAPTRLLDWTEVLHVAIYFAIAYQVPVQGATPRISVINPYRWNKKHFGERELIWPRYFGYEKREDYFYEFGEILVEGGVDWRYPVGLYSPQRNERLSAQHGFFTIHGFDHRSLDEISPDQIVAIDLKPRAVKEAKEALKYSGVDEYSLFPDLEGLARSLKNKYGIQ